MLIKQANKPQEGKVKDQEEAQVLNFAPEATWAAMGWEWRQTDIPWPPWLERKQKHTLEICDSASWYLAERNRKKDA